MDHPDLDVAQLGLKLANLRIGGAAALGAELDGRIVNLALAGARLQLPVPRDMDELLQQQRAAEVAALVARLRREGAAGAFEVAQPAFAPLVTRPQKILCVGFNYQAHAAETKTAIPKAPPLFGKFANALNHHDGTVELPTRMDHAFDYETELVIVFGRRCRDLSKDDALSAVAGYAIGNDLSARTLQNLTTQFMAGKTSDGFAPLGPWLVPAGLIPEPNDLRLRTWLNGELRQDGNTREMIFDCRDLIHYVSSIMTIEPGDVMFTGTPPGVIWGQPGPLETRRWLRAGDTVVSAIDGLGELAVHLRGSGREEEGRRS
ncbi:fumarylacetoacetate hydrolase family protein [Burkholderia plantarii]|uniref:5-carboxymethyl-2-hydoxymuconate delta-isomerase n=1 Tax=Burkholderia plantarii TaxID=41899 RepID=A0A0B6S0Q1_BURPL|nr:fumarylacetoacetate hydrolase family protein [Burkholderia plantarii]AJK45801.1 5-carboxymethyl-2-hydoxymuconate delta-isomerase [Burkholderia plantarii]